ncbi:MAG: hypothetical protein HY713_02565 [candidate division NC10 bacterium]|nr:hypothetical protein [candidate division NC10 bacterium]
MWHSIILRTALRIRDNQIGDAIRRSLAAGPRPGKLQPAHGVRPAAAATLMTAPVLLLAGILQRHLRATPLAGAAR